MSLTKINHYDWFMTDRGFRKFSYLVQQRSNALKLRTTPYTHGSTQLSTQKRDPSSYLLILNVCNRFLMSSPENNEDDASEMDDLSPQPENDNKTLNRIWDDDKIVKVSTLSLPAVHLTQHEIDTNVYASTLTMKVTNIGNVSGVTQPSRLGMQQRLCFTSTRKEVVMYGNVQVVPLTTTTKRSIKSFYRNTYNKNKPRNHLLHRKSGR